MATTTEVEGRGGLDEHGIRTDRPRLLESDDVACSTCTRSRAATAGSPRVGRSWSTPAATRAARRRRSSSSASRARRSGSGGATSTRRSPRSASRGCARRSSRTSARRTSTSSTRSPAPTPPTGLAVRVITYSPWHALFAKTLFIDPTEEELEEFEPGALVLHAPAVEADPAEDGTRSGTFVVLHPTRGRGADRRHRVRGRDQEVDLHADERPAPARRRLPDALLGERGRRRPRGGLLRAVGNGEDDAVCRPDAPPDRRRRARLGRRRRLQHRGRLLRQDDPPLAPRPSRRSSRRRARSAPCSRT